MGTTLPDSSSTPELAFEMALFGSNSEVSTTQPWRVQFTIHCLADSQTASCIISWNDFSEIFYGGSLELYHETAQGSEKVVTGPYKPLPPEPLEHFNDQIRITTESRGHFQLHEIRPGSNITLRHTLPESYHRCLIPGQRYRLRWSGRDIKHWTWGSLSHKNTIDFRNRGHLPNLRIPATEGFTFNAVEENEPWLDRARVEERFGFSTANMEEWQWRHDQAALQARRDHIRAQDSHELVKHAEKEPPDPDLPILNATLEAAPTFSTDKPFKVALHIKYEETSRKLDPITFHTYRLHGRYSLFRQENKQGQDIWAPYPIDETTGFMLVDDPDVRVNVAEHKDFVSLEQGQTYTEECNLHHPSGGYFAGDIAIGDRFRIRWNGAELDWWDWGTLHDHQDAEALLPCFIHANVIKCNKGMGNRKLAVARSRDIYATVVEST